MTITTIAQKTLDRMDDTRRLKARCGLDDDTMRVTIVGVNEQHCDALVTHDGKTYEVFLSETGVACNCRDYEMRQVTCKHCGSVALYLLGDTNPTTKERFACGDKVQLRGLRRPGKVVCVSHDLISVRWEPEGFKTAFSMAYNRVELERASL